MINVMHVDDNADDAQITKLNLLRISKDITVSRYSDAHEALEHLEEEKCDCIVCDYQMPGMDGLVFLQNLRQRDNRTPFIFLTGQGNEQLAAEALRQGADDYYSKDIGIIHYQKLVRGIERLVELSMEKVKRQETEKRIRQLAETAADMIVTIDMNGCVTFVNKATLELLKFKKEDLVGKRLFDVFPTFDLGEKVNNAYRDRLLKGEVVASEAWIETGEGEKLVVDARATVMLDEGLPYEILLIVRDQTERFNILEELKASEEKFRKFFKLAPEAYYIRKITGEFVDINEEAEKLTGYSREELLGVNIRDVNLLEKDRQEEILQATESMDSEGGVLDSNIVVCNKSGERFNADIRSVVTELNGENVILGMIRRSAKI